MKDKKTLWDYISPPVITCFMLILIVCSMIVYSNPQKEIADGNCSVVVIKEVYKFQLGNYTRLSYSNKAYIINETYKGYENRTFINWTCLAKRISINATIEEANLVIQRLNNSVRVQSQNQSFDKIISEENKIMRPYLGITYKKGEDE